MKNKKQSSIEWLISELQRRILIIESESDGIVRTTMIDNFLVDIDEAKAMHKEEIIRAGANHCYPTIEIAIQDAEEYYNEIYKSE